MRAAGRIAAPAWLTAPATQRLLAALTAAGIEARFVGGCVRDAVLGHAAADVDLATSAAPTAVMAALTAADLKAVPTGLAHGTVTAVVDGRPFEITTLRRDVATDGRHAKIAFTDDWTVDALRRDFTINALYLDPDATLFDPAQGLDDLGAGRVRFIGDADTRIEEDRLRVLRFFRFHARFGRGAPDGAALAACAAAADRLDRLSVERIAEELRRLLSLPDPRPGLGPMIDTGVWAGCAAEATETGRLLALIDLDRAEPDPWRRLAAAVSDAAAAARLAKRLKLSKVHAARLTGAQAVPPPDPGAPAQAHRAALYRHGAEAWRDAVWLARATGNDAEDWDGLLALAAAWRLPSLPVRGADLMARGIADGPGLGAALRALETVWIESDFQLDRAALLDRLPDAAARTPV